MHSGDRVESAEVERPGVKRKRHLSGPVVRLGPDGEHVDDGLKFRLLCDRAHEMPEKIALRFDMPKGRPLTHVSEHLRRILGRGLSSSWGAEGQVGRGPIAERDACLLVAVGHCRIGHTHQSVRGARRNPGHELRQVEQGGRGPAKAPHFGGEEGAIVAFAFALA